MRSSPVNEANLESIVTISMGELDTGNRKDCRTLGSSPDPSGGRGNASGEEVGSCKSSTLADVPIVRVLVD